MAVGINEDETLMTWNMVDDEYHDFGPDLESAAMLYKEFRQIKFPPIPKLSELRLPEAFWSKPDVAYTHKILAAPHVQRASRAPRVGRGRGRTRDTRDSPSPCPLPGSTSSGGDVTTDVTQRDDVTRNDVTKRDNDVTKPDIVVTDRSARQVEGSGDRVIPVMEPYQHPVPEVRSSHDLMAFSSCSESASSANLDPSEEIETEVVRGADLLDLPDSDLIEDTLRGSELMAVGDSAIRTLDFEILDDSVRASDVLGDESVRGRDVIGDSDVIMDTVRGSDVIGLRGSENSDEIEDTPRGSDFIGDSDKGSLFITARGNLFQGDSPKSTDIIGEAVKSSDFVGDSGRGGVGDSAETRPVGREAGGSSLFPGQGYNDEQKMVQHGTQQKRDAWPSAAPYRLIGEPRAPLFPTQQQDTAIMTTGLVATPFSERDYSARATKPTTLGDCIKIQDSKKQKKKRRIQTTEPSSEVEMEEEKTPEAELTPTLCQGFSAIVNGIQATTSKSSTSSSPGSSTRPTPPPGGRKTFDITVENLNLAKTTPSALRKLFEGCGEIASINIKHTDRFATTTSAKLSYTTEAARDWAVETFHKQDLGELGQVRVIAV